MAILSGRCYCGAVVYEVEDAFVYAANCHSSNCRRTTGSAFKPFAGIERQKLAVVKGEDGLLIFGDAENHDAHCKACGSLLYSQVREAAWVHVTMGTLVDAPAIRPTHQSSSAPRRSGTRSPTTCRNIAAISSNYSLPASAFSFSPSSR